MKFKPLVPVILASVGVSLAMAVPGRAADKVTYYEDVAPIFRANCQSCHQPSGMNIGSLVAPMSLMTYEETRPWARAIARKVEAKEMPPWFASEPKGVFSNERGLTDKQIQTILAWVDAGAPAGDRTHAAPPSVSVETETGGWSLGKPDFIVKIPKPFFVPDEAKDLQVTFYTKLTDEQLPHDVNVRAWEFRTGSALPGKYTVHHMCGGLEEPGFDENAAEENAEAVGLSLGCIAGGAEPTQLPDGYGLAIKKGSTITMSMHYYKEPGPGTGYMNEAEIGFFLTSGPVAHKVLSRAIGNTFFEIPPGSERYRVGAAVTLKKDTEVLAYWPHAHLRAVSARYMATYPDGHKEVLLDVPRYDQSWQVTYKYRQPKLLPKGTRIDVDMTYDNTAARGAKRGFDTNKTILEGPRTQDEMMLGFFSYTEHETADSETQQQQ
jgi:mono/diheme cytochrome c family protein